MVEGLSDSKFESLCYSAAPFEFLGVQTSWPRQPSEAMTVLYVAFPRRLRWLQSEIGSGFFGSLLEIVEKI